METGLATISDRPTQVSTSVWDRLDPMEFINTYGKVFALTGAGGCKTEMDGKLMALACLSQKTMIFDIARRYHLMDGKLVTKSETMLADFRKAGGDITWINNGADGVEAHVKLMLNGKSAEYKFNIATAQKAGYIRKGSNWEKRPDQQLRARCVTDLMHMQWPELCDGDYTAEEVEDFSQVVEVVKSTPKAKPTEKPPESKPAKETVIDVEVESQPFAQATEAKTESVQNSAKVEQAPFDTATSKEPPKGDADESTIPSAADSTFTAELLEIESLIAECGWKSPDLLEKFNGKFQTSHGDFGGFNEEQRALILGNLRRVCAKHKDAIIASK